MNKTIVDTVFNMALQRRGSSVCTIKWIFKTCLSCLISLMDLRHVYPVWWSQGMSVLFDGVKTCLSY